MNRKVVGIITDDSFRTIYDENHSNFMEHLGKRIKYFDKEIERMCNNYYQGFIDSIRDLQQVRSQAKTLHVSISCLLNPYSKTSEFQYYLFATEPSFRYGQSHFPVFQEI